MKFMLLALMNIFSEGVSNRMGKYIEEILPKEYLHIYIEKDLSKGENFRK